MTNDHQDPTPGKGHNKGKKKTDLIKVYESFFEKPRTMKEADVDCGVMRESICRYVARLQRGNKIALIRKRRCAVTRCIAGEYTTDVALFPSNSQLTLFDPC